MIQLSEVVSIHQLLISHFGGAAGIRDISLLSSALQRPFQTFDGQFLYTSVLEKAAALLESILVNHPFIDGNKRTGYVLLRQYLLQNKWTSRRLKTRNMTSSFLFHRAGFNLRKYFYGFRNTHMTTFTDQQIDDIWQQLDMGFNVFYHKITGELLFIPDQERFNGTDQEAWEEDIEKLIIDRFNYQEIRSMQSHDSFQVMAAFSEQVANAHLRHRLIQALQKKHPFREFNHIIHNCPERENWFDFKKKQYMSWTREQVV